jgi:histone-lysine N-methyltransferase SETD3
LRGKLLNDEAIEVLK